MPAFGMPAKNRDAPLAALRMSHTCLRVPDYEVEKRWFTETLGFRLVIEWPGPVGVAMCYVAAPDDDGCIVEIVGDGDAPQPRPATKKDLFASLGVAGFHHLCFTVPDVAATVEVLRARGVTIDAEPFEVAEIGRRIAFFSDPFGNLFELEQVL